MPHALLADLVTALHLAVVLFVATGVLAVPLGGLLGWRWVRNPSFRLVHLAIVGYLVLNVVRGELCFLTHWERGLREAAGQTPEDRSFVGRLLHDLVFVRVDQDLLHALYLGAAVLVLVGLFLVPPRWRKRTA